MKRIVVTNINWDGGDGTLPSRVVIHNPSAAMIAEVQAEGFADQVAEWLTSAYGYCVGSFDTVLEDDAAPAVDPTGLDDIRQLLEHAYTGARAVNDVVGMTRVARAIAALDSPVDMNIFTREFEDWHTAHECGYA